MMARTSNCCRTRASLVALVVFVIFPGRSGCREYNYKSLTEDAGIICAGCGQRGIPSFVPHSCLTNFDHMAKPECCIREDAEIKRSKDIDYDSFVGLMGRRSVAQPKKTQRKRHIDHIFADMLGRLTGMACPCVEEYLQTKRGQPINYGRQRFQRVP